MISLDDMIFLLLFAPLSQHLGLCINTSLCEHEGFINKSVNSKLWTHTCCWIHRSCSCQLHTLIRYPNSVVGYILRWLDHWQWRRGRTQGTHNRNTMSTVGDSQQPHNPTQRSLPARNLYRGGTPERVWIYSNTFIQFLFCSISCSVS